METEKDFISFKEIYNNLRKITVSDRTKSKNGLDYMPWATAWDEICSHYNASYEFITFDNSQTIVGVTDSGEKIMGGMDDPYLVTKAGLMVATSVTVEGHTRYMQLPVMDFRNTSMALEERQVGKNKVSAANMNDINKATMRCLAKNIAMFGLAINLWTGEDVPDAIVSVQKAATEAMGLIAQKKKAASENKDERASAKIDEILLTNLPKECNGDPRLCEDEETLNALVKKLKTVRVKVNNN